MRDAFEVNARPHAAIFLISCFFLQFCLLPAMSVLFTFVFSFSFRFHSPFSFNFSLFYFSLFYFSVFNYFSSFSHSPFLILAFFFPSGLFFCRVFCAPRSGSRTRVFMDRPSVGLSAWSQLGLRAGSGEFSVGVVATLCPFRCACLCVCVGVFEWKCECERVCTFFFFP